MMVVALKTKLKWLIAGVIVLVCLAVLITAVALNLRGEEWAMAADLKYRVSAQDEAGRVQFLEQFGWQVSPEPVEVSEIVIPVQFNEVYEQYNLLQKEHGLDLKPYAGKTCKKWVYQVTNYPDPNESVRATLLIVDGKVIGGDLSSVALDGFMVSFLGKKDSTEQASLTIPDTVEYAETAVQGEIPQGAWPID